MAAAEERNTRDTFVLETTATTAAVVAKLNQLSKIQGNIRQLNQFGQDVASNPESVDNLIAQWTEARGNLTEADSSKISIILSNANGSLSGGDCQSIKEKIKELNIKMAEDTVTLGAIVSASIIMLQIWRLKEVWMAIKDAQNVVGDSKTKIALIQVNIGQLEEDALELRELMTQFEAESVTELEKKKLLRKIRMKVSRLYTEYIDTQKMMSRLQFKIDGKQQVLAVYQREQITNGIMNGLHGVTNLIQFIQFGGMLGTGLKVLQGGITAGFLALAAGNTYMYCITSETIQQIRDVLAEIDQMEIQLAAILKTIHEAEDFVVLHDEED